MQVSCPSAQLVAVLRTLPTECRRAVRRVCRSALASGPPVVVAARNAMLCLHPAPLLSSFAVNNEYCETPEDFIARRTRLAFLDKLACEQALPRVSWS